MTKWTIRGDLPKEPAIKIERQLLLSPGIWRNQNITSEAIKNGMKNTDWNNKENLELIYDHADHSDMGMKNNFSTRDWVGYISKPQYLTLNDGVSNEGMYADISIYDDSLARKMAYGDLRCGISSGMKFDYRTKNIEYFKRQSVVKNPGCKKAFLTLADEGVGMDMIEPSFLTLADDNNTIERGIDDKNMNTKDEDKVKILEDEKKTLEEKIAKLENDKVESDKAKAEADKIASEAKAKEAPKEEPREEPKTKVEDKKQEPVVIEKTVNNVSDNSEVVKAINDMKTTFTEDVKRLAQPATVAQTNPNAMTSSEDTTTNELVEQYLDLHPEKKHE